MYWSSKTPQVSPFTNAKVVLAAQVIGSLVWLVTISVLANRMEHAAFGQFLYLFAVAAGLEAFTDAGLRFTVVTRLVSASDTDSRSRVFGGAIAAKVLLSLFALIFIVVLVAAGLIRTESSIEIVMTAAVLVTLPSTNPLVWVLRSASMQWYEGISLVIYRVLLIAIVLIAAPTSLCTACVLTIMTIANLIFTILVLRPAMRAIGQIRPMNISETRAMAWQLVRESVGFGLSLVFSQFSARFWVLLLGYYALSRELVAVSTSQMIIQSVLMLGVAVGSSYLPYLGNMINSDIVSFQRVAKSMMLMGLAIGTAFGIGVNFASPIIMVHVFGQEGDQATAILKILSCLSPIILVSFIVRYVLSSMGRSGDEFRANLYGIAPAVMISPVVLQWLGVSYVLFLYILGELVTLVAKLVSAQTALGIQFREFIAVSATTLSILVVYFLVMDSRFIVESTDVFSGLVGTTVVTVLVLATFAIVHYRYFKPFWKTVQGNSP